jgi:hypothetical protein
MPKDCNVDLIEVLLWLGDRAITLKNTRQSVFDDLSFFAFTNELTCSYSLYEQPVCILDKTPDNL